jgi:hypothetical protein
MRIFDRGNEENMSKGGQLNMIDFITKDILQTLALKYSQSSL